MNQKRTFSIFAKTCLGIGALSLCLNTFAFWNSEEPPSRALDPAYGMALYDFYQGNSFHALTQLHIARERGGIKGHGDYPALVEGGLLLSYGMTREAKAIFEQLLKDKLSPEDRNLAWFYLGKVFYLEQNEADAQLSFARVNTLAFKKEDPEAYYELVYLKSQLDSQKDSKISAGFDIKKLIPVDHIYHYYLRYNAAVTAMDGKDNAQTKQMLNALIQSLAEHNAEPEAWFLSDEEQNHTQELLQERYALQNQALLSLGQLYLDSKQYQLAMDTLKQVEQDSAFSDQALFAYAIAASKLTQYPQALGALNTLNERRLANPWQQQTPYALAYLYEQLKEPVLALEAYRAAVGRYEELQAKLEAEQNNLNVDTILTALKIDGSLGTDVLEKDAYGRVDIKPHAFSFAALLASEAFQRQVSELHELYALRFAFNQWTDKLLSAEDLLATRLLSRQEKIQALQAQLLDLNVEKWSSKQAAFVAQINEASVNEQARFFMTDEQIAYVKRLEKAAKRLSELPADHPKYDEYKRRYQRASAYFSWWIEDQYPVNRWHAQKQLNELNRQMVTFNKQFTLLNEQESMDASHAHFQERINNAQSRLDDLELHLNKSITHSGEKLVALVDQAMTQQLAEISRYLLASREALARIADQLLESGTLKFTSQQNLEEGAE